MSNTTFPLISIIMPAFNAEHYICESIESVLGQSYPNIELIVINDGSTDNTVDKISRLMGSIIYVKTENKGVSAARNLGIQHAKGEWLAFLDADDIWFPNKLQLQFDQLNGCNWSYTDSYYLGEKFNHETKRSELSPLLAGNIFNHLLTENIITTSSVLVKKSLIQNVGGFDETLEALEDWKLWLDIAKENPISYINEPLLKYRVYPGSTSRKARKMLPLHKMIIDHAIASLGSTANTSVIQNRAKYNSLNVCSYIAEDSQDFSFSLYCAYRAYLLFPWKITTLKRLVRCVLNSIRFAFTARTPE
jgi:glycosyltransferase involved in cell wall biosynthesis